MQVPEEARKCVVFLGFRNRNGVEELGGTGFFVVRRDDKLKRSFAYVITAKHNIDKIREQAADEVLLRVNLKNGGTRWEKTPISDWHYHPDIGEIDVALLRWQFPEDADHVYLPTETFATAEKLEMYEIVNGDDVVITGLFQSHSGRKRNIPIVRFGNIAAMPEEQIQSQEWGMIDAYLIEGRSTGAISGSPVFVDLGAARILRGQLVQAYRGPTYYLLGLMHGHWEDRSSDDQVAVRPNMGIAIVVPAEKILEVIHQPLIKKLDVNDATKT
jgi:hypothetical protein